MNIADIADPQLRVKFKEIAAMTESDLKLLGLNSKIRNQAINNILLPEDQSQCWAWAGYFHSCGSKKRPGIFQGKVFLASRVLMALLLRKHIQNLQWALHKCPIRENGQCVNPFHLSEGTPKENAEDRSRYRTLHGDANGSRRRPESRPRGGNHPYSQFKGAEGRRCVQILRATWDAAVDKRGLIAALARVTKRSVDAVRHVIKRQRYTDIAHDPSAALDLSQLKINRPEHSAAKRDKTTWPKGDSHAGARMPVAAKEAYVLLFHRLRKVRDRSRLISFCVEKYGLSRSRVQKLGYTDPTKLGAPPRSEIRAMAPIDGIDVELLEGLFAPFPKIQRGGGTE